MNKSKGIEWPSVLFGIALVIGTFFSTFNGLPLAFLSLIGCFIEGAAISTAIYAPEYTLLRRSITAIPVWIIGALLIRLGGMDTLIVGALQLNLYLIPTLLGATYYPANQSKL